MSEQITKEQLFGGIAAPSEPHMACVYVRIRLRGNV